MLLHLELQGLATVPVSTTDAHTLLHATTVAVIVPWSASQTRLPDLVRYSFSWTYAGRVASRSLLWGA